MEGYPLNMAPKSTEGILLKVCRFILNLSNLRPTNFDLKPFSQFYAMSPPFRRTFGGGGGLTKINEIVAPGLKLQAQRPLGRSVVRSLSTKSKEIIIFALQLGQAAMSYLNLLPWEHNWRNRKKAACRPDQLVLKLCMLDGSPRIQCY